MPCHSDLETFDPSLDFKAADTGTRWRQGWLLLSESFTEYCSFVHLYQTTYLGRPQATEPRTAAELHSDLPLFIDEVAIELHTFMTTRKVSLLLMLHTQIFIDLNFTLGEEVERGFEEFRTAASRIGASLEEHRRVTGAPPSSSTSSICERGLDQLLYEVGIWTKEEDIVTVVLQATGRPHVRSVLMQRNPFLCGLVLFQLHLKHQRLGLIIANKGVALLSLQLYAACKHSGSPPGQSELQWADMDKLLEMHEAQDLFGGKAPANLSESLLTYCCAGPRRRLQDGTEILPIFKHKYIGNGKAVHVDVTVIKSLLTAVQVREENKALKEAAASAGSKARKRNLLRKERSHHDAKYSIPQLLAVLETGLRLETESIRFDYVAMHSRCLRALRALRKVAPSFLSARRGGGGYADSDECLPELVGHILTDAARSGQVLVRNEITGAEERVWSRTLASASAVLTTFLASEQQGIVSELGGLRLGGGLS